MNECNGLRSLYWVFHSDSYTPPNHYCSIQCRQTINWGRMAGRPVSPCPGLTVLTMLDEFWMQQSEIHPSPRKNSPIAKIVSSGSPTWVHRDKDSDLEERIFFLYLLLFKCCAQVCDFVVYLQKGFHGRHAACLENTLDAQLWKTAHRLTKGSKPMGTFCLSPLLCF